LTFPSGGLYAQSTFSINEILTDTDRDHAVLYDENGDPEDWIEIRNTGSSNSDIGGFYLTDDPNNPTKWMFPTPTPIPAGEFLVVFASNKNRAVTGSELHTNFQLDPDGEYLALFAQNGNTIVSSFSPTYLEQFDHFSYGRIGTSPTLGFFQTPTPGTTNTEPPGAPAPPVSFSVASQAFTGSFTLTLTTPSPGAVIHYTTDRSEPDNSSPQYTGPISITTTTRLRARAIQDGFAPGPVSSQTYHLMAENVADFTSDLPVVVLDGFGGGRPSRLTSMHWMIFDRGADGRSSLRSAPDLVTPGTMRIRGSSSAGFPKFSLAIEAQDEEGFDRNISPLGLPSESDWVLSGRYTFDRALMRNPLVYALSNQMGLYATRTRFVEVFINTDDGLLDYDNDYMGVYSIIEKIKRDNDRVDVSRLTKSDLTEPELTGGYIVKMDRLDPGDNGWVTGRGLPTEQPNASFSRMNHVYPKEEIIEDAQRDYIRGYINEFEEALYTPGFVNPDTGLHYRDYIDVPSFIDYSWLSILSQNPDAYRLSAFLNKPREGKLRYGPAWDYDRTMGSIDGRSRDPEIWVLNGDTADFFTWGWWENLFSDPDFTQEWTDRWAELRAGTFSEDNILSLVDTFAAEIAESQERNFERWTEREPRGGSHASEVDILKSWLSRRVRWIDTQFVSRPVISPQGGRTAPGLTASLGGATGTIYYTTNGSDPRLPGGAVNPAATAISGGLQEISLITSASTARGLRPTSDIGTTWHLTTFDDSAWQSTTPPAIGYEQSAGSPNSYLPLLGLDIFNASGQNATSAYLRVPFTLASPDNITSLTLSMKYDDGFVAFINGTRAASENDPNPLPWNAAATALHEAENAAAPEVRDLFPIVLEPLRPSLVSGQNILALHALNDGTPNAGNDGSGSSDMVSSVRLLASMASSGNIPVSSPRTIIARAREDDRWSSPVRAVFLDQQPANASNLVISEVMYHPPSPDSAEEGAGFTKSRDFEYIELYNPTDIPVDLRGVSVTEGFPFTFAPETPLAILPGETGLIVRNRSAFEFRYGQGLPILGEWRDPAQADDGSKLSNSSEQILLLAADRSPIADFTYIDRDGWPRAADGRGSSLTLARPQTFPDPQLSANWYASFTFRGTPGTVSSDPLSAWRTSVFSPAQLDNSAISGNLVDIDGDGSPNLAEFAAGTDPFNASDHPTIIPGSTPGSGGNPAFTTTLRRRTNIPGLTQDIERSTDLSTWIPAASTTTALTDHRDGTETVTLRITDSAATGGQAFFRARISYQP